MKRADKGKGERGTEWFLPCTCIEFVQEKVTVAEEMAGRGKRDKRDQGEEQHHAPRNPNAAATIPERERNGAYQGAEVAAESGDE